MKNPLPLALGLALLAVPTNAQITPANGTAPNVSGGITFANNASVELKYASISWRQGRWADALAAKSEQMRQMVNMAAQDTPIGELSTSTELDLGGVKIAAGTYTLAFTLDEEFKWTLMLSNDDAKHEWKLDLKEGSARNTRLTISLQAGEQDNACTLGIAFGTMACKIPGSIAMETRRRPGG